MKAEMLFGGKTRFAILEALAEAKRQLMTAYQIAMIKGLDPAATYRCLAEFSELGIVVKSEKERNQTLYTLSERTGKAAAELLRLLKQQEQQPKSMDLEEWLSPEMQAKRMAKIARLDSKRPINTIPALVRKPYQTGKVKEVLSKRAPGELSALVASSKIAFDELFERKQGSFVLKE